MKNDLMMNMKKMISGFTIAELLISMLISAVLIAALVPVVGVKKVKYPAERLQHGIAECYYQGNSLRYYYQDNTNPEKNRNEVVNSDHCTFTVPATARYVQVFVIGHGGKAVSSDAFYTMNLGNKYEGDIHVNGLFQQHIERANSQVRGLADIIRASLNDWANVSGLTGEFNVVSPIGAGGPGMCHAQILTTNDPCLLKCGNGDFPSNPGCPGPLENTSPPYYWASKGAAAAQLLPLLNRQAEIDFDCHYDEGGDRYSNGCTYCGIYDLGPWGFNCTCAPGVHYPSNHEVCGQRDDICDPSDLITTDCLCDLNRHYPVYHPKCGTKTVVYCDLNIPKTPGCECRDSSLYPVGHGCNPEPLRDWCDIDYPTPNCVCNTHISYPEGHKCNPQLIPDPVESPEPKCWAYIHGQGQQSGVGVRKTVYIPINGDSIIKVEESLQRAGVSVTTNNEERHIYLTSSGSGSAPVFSNGEYTTPNTTPAAAGCETNIANGCDGRTNTSTNQGTATGTVLPIGRQCELHYDSANTAKSGKIDYTDDNIIKYTYEPASINLTHGTGGKPGEIYANVYEKLTGVLNLYPASGYESNSYFTKNSTNISVTSPARPGADGEVKEGTYQISANLNPVIPEIRNLAKADNATVFAEYLSKINSASVNGGLKGCDAAGTCPGFGGTGSYLNMKKIKASNALKLNYRGSQYPVVNAMNNTRSFNSSCDPGDSSQAMAGTPEYSFERCYNQNRMQGNPGAVIIVW